VSLNPLERDACVRLRATSGSVQSRPRPAWVNVHFPASDMPTATGEILCREHPGPAQQHAKWILQAQYHDQTSLARITGVRYHSLSIGHTLNKNIAFS
ncbi:hypothetical protein U1Q18_051658, partial [Sarracenia purpurea var. burkii]